MEDVVHGCSYFENDAEFYWEPVKLFEVNFGALAAEIVSLVWGTPANFNGFRVLAALLHGALVVAVSQTLRR